jgi:phosphoribosyl-ATP pyrophosphohydrolase
LYYLIVTLVAKGVTLEEIKAELVKAPPIRP